jgi:uncharacterized protein
MRIAISVRPNSSKQEIIKMDKQNYKIYLKKPATEGKANKELINLLKKYFKSPVKLISGFSSKNKIIEVEECQ